MSKRPFFVDFNGSRPINSAGQVPIGGVINTSTGKRKRSAGAPVFRGAYTQWPRYWDFLVALDAMPLRSRYGLQCLLGLRQDRAGTMTAAGMDREYFEVTGAMFGAAMSRSANTAQRVLNDLEDYGWIEVIRRPVVRDRRGKTRKQPLIVRMTMFPRLSENETVATEDFHRHGDVAGNAINRAEPWKVSRKRQAKTKGQLWRPSVKNDAIITTEEGSLRLPISSEIQTELPLHSSRASLVQAEPASEISLSEADNILDTLGAITHDDLADDFPKEERQAVSDGGIPCDPGWVPDPDREYDEEFPVGDASAWNETIESEPVAPFVGSPMASVEQPEPISESEPAEAEVAPKLPEVTPAVVEVVAPVATSTHLDDDDVEAPVPAEVMRKRRRDAKIVENPFGYVWGEFMGRANALGKAPRLCGKQKAAKEAWAGLEPQEQTECLAAVHDWLEGQGFIPVVADWLKQLQWRKAPVMSAKAPRVLTDEQKADMAARAVAEVRRLLAAIFLAGRHAWPGNEISDGCMVGPGPEAHSFRHDDVLFGWLDERRALGGETWAKVQRFSQPHYAAAMVRYTASRGLRPEPPRYEAPPVQRAPVSQEYIAKAAPHVASGAVNALSSSLKAARLVEYQRRHGGRLTAAQIAECLLDPDIKPPPPPAPTWQARMQCAPGEAVRDWSTKNPRTPGAPSHHITQSDPEPTPAYVPVKFSEIEVDW